MKSTVDWGGLNLHAALVVFALLGFAVPTSAATGEAEIWKAKARSIVLGHHLLPRSILRCAALIYDGTSTSRVASVTAVEKHGGQCGGDPNFASRILTMTIDKASGQAAWDHDTGGEMKPIR